MPADIGEYCQGPGVTGALVARATGVRSGQFFRFGDCQARTVRVEGSAHPPS